MTKIRLSPYHKIFYNEWKINPNANCYNIVFDQVLSHHLDLSRLQNALDRFISEYFILNSHIISIHEELYWVQNSQINKLKQFANGYSNQEILDYVALPFNLETGPLYRFAIFSEVDGDYRFILVLHSILIDANSFITLITNISKYYNDPTYKSEICLLEQVKKINSVTNKLWDKLELHKANNKRFWTKQLFEVEPLDLRFIRDTSSSYEPMPGIPDLAGIHKFKTMYFNFTGDILAKLKVIEKQHNLSIYWYSQIIFAILLYKYTSQNKFAISYLTPMKECKGLVYGSNINTNVAPYQIDGITTILDLLTKSKQFIDEVSDGSIDNSAYPINEIIECSNKGALDVFFVETDFRDTRFDFKGVKTININHKVKIDVLAELFFEVEIKIDAVNFRVRYNESAINEVILAKFVRHYQKLFTDVLNNLEQGIIDRTILDYPILDTKEYQEIVYDWNQTDREYSENKTIHQLFEEQVLKTPNNVAVVYEDKKLTYQELNERANQLAHCLRAELQIVGDDLITLFLDRSEYILIAIIAVLKAGAAYVPIDTKYPDAHIKHVLKDTKTKVVLTNLIYKDKLRKIAVKSGVIPLEGCIYHEQLCVIDIDNIKFQDKFKNYSLSNLESKITSTNLAYVIYTSGTTGKPKGVMIEHHSIVNRIEWMNKCYPLTNGDNILQKTPYGFDVSVWELFYGLWCGAKVVFANSEESVNSGCLIKLIDKKNISIIHFVPSMLEIFIDFCNSLGNTKGYNLNSLKHIFCSGEELHLSVVRNMQFILPNIKIHNLYGPTEASIDVLYYDCIKGMFNQICIGKPVFNSRAYILDINKNPVPIGAIGELYIGGAGVARGYLNQPELTRERFIANPFQTEMEKKQGKNGRLYKTGDLVRYLPDGNIEYIGRNDFQVKIRGYRIELGEIENVLGSYPGIKQTVVCQKTESLRSVADGGEESGESTTVKYLVGYYVADERIDQDDLLQYMSERLPEYMIPSALVQLDKLPLTINGKLDRKALPTPDFTQIDIYVAPKNELESKLCQIYAETLGLMADKISITSNFFKLGGNSILAIKMVGRINQQFNSAVKVSSLFTSSSIEKVAILVQSTANEFEYKEYLINSTETDNLYQQFYLSNAQQAYYLGRFPEFELGNVSTHYYSEIKFANLDYLKLEVALNKLIQRHLSLRTIFIDGYQQYLASVPEYKIRYSESTDMKTVIAIRNELSHKIYKVEYFPQFDFVVTKLDNCYILHISYDILAMDANSYQILAKELGILYANPNARLPALNVAYKDYITKLAQIRESKLFAKAEKYWVNKLDEYNFEMNLPLKCKSLMVKKPYFKRVSKVIAKDIWHKVTDKARLHGIGVTSLLLTIYAKVLSYWTNQTELCINLTLFNRLPLHEDINDVIGDFTVLELFSYKDQAKKTIFDELQKIHQELWLDIEHNLFDGVDFQRLIRKERLFPSNHVLCPIVLTSILGSSIGYGESLINDSYLGIEYSITQTSQIWLDNKAYETKDGFVAEWDYVEQLFEPEVIEAMHKHYCELIQFIANTDWEQIAFPKLLLPTNDLKLIEKANSAIQPIIADTLFGYYENYITKNQLQTNTAVIEYADVVRRYSYAQLLDDSVLLAKYLYSLINRHCEDGSPPWQSILIAVLSENGYNQVLATLSIMKAGCAYLPLNIDWPVGRLDEVLIQGQVNIILVSRAEASKAEIRETLASKYKLVIIEDILDEIHSKDNINCHACARNDELKNISLPVVNADDVAYVIFTSGSTGRPKGVTISHRGALNTIIAVNDKYQVTAKDSVLALSDLSFDLSVYDIFGLLAVGGTVVFPEQNKTKDVEHWLELVESHGITIWNTVPQLASLFLEDCVDDKRNLQSLRLFLLSGDWIPLELPSLIKDLCGNATIVSLGGATEGSIWSIWYEIASINPNWHVIPYGMAMPNQKMYVLNHNLEHCPIDVAGEIYIGGMGVALNYWNNDEKTATSFLVHPDLGRLYKTGDLAKWNPDGYIEFLGRSDDQVKINGFRVELGEIVAKLDKVPGVDKAVVTVQHVENQSYIIAYLFSQQEDFLSGKLQSTITLKEHIEKYIRDQLPEYMLPYDYVVLRDLPLTANGKLNFNKLPKLEMEIPDEISSPPENEIEAKVCELFAEVLSIKTRKIQMHSDFFRLGGNSLLAIKLVSKLNHAFKTHLKIADIFMARTAYALAARII